MVFSQREWQNMRVLGPEDEGNWVGEGYFRTRLGRKPVVVHVAPIGGVSFAVRPIVRVPMERA
jgi:hypothetical protein